MGSEYIQDTLRTAWDIVTYMYVSNLTSKHGTTLAIYSGTPSTADNIGTADTLLISKVSSLQGLLSTYACSLDLR